MTAPRSEVTWCGDIGMHTVNRPRCVSCVHKTIYCEIECYNNRVETQYGDAIDGKDLRNEVIWRDPAFADTLRADLDRKRTRQTKRVRLMSRGEAFASVADVDRVARIARANPDRLIWVPTRAWRNDTLRKLIESRIAILPNVVILASLDPSNTAREYRMLRNHGWATMYFGDPADLQVGWEGPAEPVKCPKTHRHMKGHCAICKAGCFSRALRDTFRGLNGHRVDVHLVKH